jgi:hypothetical protein
MPFTFIFFVQSSSQTLVPQGRARIIAHLYATGVGGGWVIKMLENRKLHDSFSKVAQHLLRTS